MCDLEKDINFECSDDNDALKVDVGHSFEDDLKDFPEILTFIRRLQDCIIRQREIILKCYQKMSKKDEVICCDVKNVVPKNIVDASTQTYDDDFQNEPSSTACGSPADRRSIVDQVTEIAETAVRQTGFVYEASSGMYYDYNTGYYYNAELGLYYDGNSGSYFTYDESTKTFNYHSSVNNLQDQKDLCSFVEKPQNIVLSSEEINNDPSTKQSKNNEHHEKMEMEEGECSDVSSEHGDNKAGDIRLNNSKTDDVTIINAPIMLNDSSSLISLDEIANGWPPCMRVLVQETGLENLKVGTLFIVTYNGGTLGREGNHSVIIPDITISKHHASFKFCEEKKCYTIVDLGSRNGTFLNGNRLSVALQESPPHPITHGNVLRVGSTYLLCHIHVGQETCEQCEPGCVASQKSDKGEAVNECKQIRHRSELRRLRRKFGLEGPGAGIRVAPNNSLNYQDRAEARRKAVGSSDDNEKTEVGSVFQSIKSDNKGFQLMSKMGWQEGQPLGKDSNSDSAITEPIIVEQRPDKAGLGSLEGSQAPEELSSTTKRKITVWKKTLKRFNESS